MAELQSRLQGAVGDTYRIDRELGGGGMSRVFLAEEVDLGRRVVIKVLPPEMAAGVNQERFRREIQLAARLQHPHVVPLLSAGSADDLLYYMMPYIEGESLRAKLAREGELPVGDAVKILKEVIDALAYAHRHGVVHRDIKPDNVLLSEGHATVTDFGVAKAVSASTGESSLTSLGVALGTPAYMAPEQAVADPNVDHRADIYAVGAMAYEMLTGRPPFTGPNPQAVLSAHVTDAPEPATKYRETVPQALNELVMRCLQKKAADRWQKAEEMLPHLDAISTPTGGITPTGTAPVPAVDYETLARQAHPVRVAAMFGAASVVVLGVVYLIMIQLGLPDWVFLGAVALLAVGLPIMLVTGHHERQRAVALTAGLHVPTPTNGVQRWFTWRTAIVGGGLAFAGLAVVATGYMVMRLTGIGPVGTLVASGVLEEHGRLIVADFEDRTADATLGESVTEAFRIDLSQSPMVRLMDALAVAQALQRMNRDPAEGLDVETARQLAQREAVKAIVAGDIGTLGRSYVISVRLLASADGTELIALRETAEDDAAIIGAVDRLSGKLRERIGESLKTIRANQPLERVTTASLSALRRYSRGVLAEEQGDVEGAISLLEEAIELDSSFAMAYRKLAVVLSNAQAPRSQVMAAAGKAFELRDRLPEIEGYLATAYYYSNVAWDRSEVIRAYRAVLDIDPDQATALNNLAIRLFGLRQFAEAEQLLSHAIEVDQSVLAGYINLAGAQVAQEKLAEVDSTMVLFTEAFSPDNPFVLWTGAALAAVRKDYAAAQEQFRRMGEAQRSSLSMRGISLVGLASTAQLTGRVKLADRYYRDAMAVNEQQDNPGAYLRNALELAWQELLYRDDPEEAVRIVKTALQHYSLANMEPSDRPYSGLADFYATAGSIDAATALMMEYEREVDEVIRRGDFFRHAAAAAIALAEGRGEDAIAAYRAWEDEGAGTIPTSYRLAQAYDVLGNADSALTIYQRAVSTPRLFPKVYEDDRRLWQGYLRLGELYEERGESEKAVEYYNEFVALWKDADSELQPQVTDVKRRITRLVGERR